MRNIENISANEIDRYIKAKLQICNFFGNQLKTNPSSASNKKRSCFSKIPHLLLTVLLFAITNYAFAEICENPRFAAERTLIDDRLDPCRTGPPRKIPPTPEPPTPEPPIPEPPIPEPSITSPVPGIDIFKDTSGDFDKPLIIVEGYDPVNAFSARNLYDLIPGRLIDDLKLNGRDIITVSFTDGSKSLRENSINLKNFIHWVNGNKIGNYPNGIIGISAGGLISRHALKSMENLNSPHDTALYISIDTPHRGAFVSEDIAPALIHMREKIKKYGRFASILSFLTFGLFDDGQDQNGNMDENIKFFDSDAAKEMLVVNPQSSVFFEELDSLGHPDDLVRIAYAIGDTDGMGTGIGSQPSTSLLRYRLKFTGLKRYHYHIQVGDCYLPCDQLNGHYASSAGSTSKAISILYNSLKEAGSSKLPIYEYNPTPVGFIPTFSALDFKHFDMNTPYTEEIKNYSPFDYIYVTSGNGTHDGNGIASMINENMGNIIADINNFHMPDPQIPSRSEKITPLESIAGRLDTELVRISFGATEYYLDWDTVEGATHYEIFLNKSLIKTATNQSAMISISSSSNVQVRACNKKTCSYPVSRNIVHHHHDDGREIE